MSNLGGKHRCIMKKPGFERLHNAKNTQFRVVISKTKGILFGIPSPVKKYIKFLNLNKILFNIDATRKTTLTTMKTELFNSQSTSSEP